MADRATTPQVEDLVSVGTRVSWAAIFGGALVAFAIYFMLTILGAAVGLTVSDNVKSTTLRSAAVWWAILTLSAALFVGGVLTSLFTVGENKVESVFYGVILWAVLLLMVLILGAAGVRGGFGGAVRLVHVDPSTSTANWEAAAQEAGVSADTIAEWRRKTAATAEKAAAKVEDNQKEIKDAATRVAWYTFAGIWLSMLAAAGGAWLVQVPLSVLLP